MQDSKNNETQQSGLPYARVTAVHRERYALTTEQSTFFGRLKRSVYFGDGGETLPTVGDYVHYHDIPGGDAQIIHTLPRKSQFIRRDPNPQVGEQVVAANFDYVFIMTSLNKDFSVNRVLRYLVLARQSGATPVVVLTKADLADDIAAKIDAVRVVSGGTDIIALSTVTGAGFDRLAAYLAPQKTIVFLGMSGVGKSSLLNALIGKDVMEVNAIREADSRGRHTTTHRQLFTLPCGAMIIDTPGMRSLGMWDVEDGITETFSDVEALLGACRFSDCRHQNEPGCAIKKAIEHGEISAARWENYQKLKREALHSKRQSAALQAKSAKSKSIAKRNKDSKKETW